MARFLFENIGLGFITDNQKLWNLFIDTEKVGETYYAFNISTKVTDFKKKYKLLEKVIKEIGIEQIKINTQHPSFFCHINSKLKKI
jgi:hypothetical protein